MKNMNVGIALIPEYIGLEKIPHYAVRAEKKGFHSVWIPEHHMHGDAFTLLSAAAAKTEKILLGTGVVSVFTRHPAITAMSIDTLNKVSGGRAILGIGLGDEQKLHHCFGYDVSRPTEALFEAVSIMKKYFAGRVDFEGKRFKAVGLSREFSEKPPKILIAAVGPKMLEVAGTLGDGVIFSALSSIPYIREAVRIVREACVNAGRDPEQLEYAGMVVSAAPKNMTELKKLAAMYLSWPHRAERVLIGELSDRVDVSNLKRLVAEGFLDEAVSQIDDSIIFELAIVTSRNVETMLDRFFRAGLTLPILYPIGQPDYLQTIL
ncbi:MAG: LLM class flavin-dependent oxidoreductase [Candidatus Caldarchaeum sp.]|uniref:LLM class flavin-dependent oxidoreductase n=1 Tax=Caldiarchaeum subterraneum TaxID=311458 RepID=A0A7C5LDY0_CALS0